MVKYDSLVKLEKEISDLRSKIRRLESEKSMHESKKSSAQTRSNIGLTTMPINMSLGLSMKIMADGDVRNIESKISSLSSQISSSKSELRRLEHEFDEMVKTWKAERAPAPLPSPVSPFSSNAAVFSSKTPLYCLISFSQTP